MNAIDLVIRIPHEAVPFLILMGLAILILLLGGLSMLGAEDFFAFIISFVAIFFFLVLVYCICYYGYLLCVWIENNVILY